MDVRVLDPYSGPDDSKVERQLTSLQNSGEIITISSTDSTGVDAQAVIVGGSISWTSISLNDEFISFAQQYKTFRIKAIRFDVYDINPAVVVNGVFSTWHDVFTATTVPAFTFNNTLDSADSQYVAPGTGKVSFVWVARTPLERSFQATAPGTNPFPDFGGLRYNLLAASGSATKYRVISKAVVQFRGRI